MPFNEVKQIVLVKGGKNKEKPQIGDFQNSISALHLPPKVQAHIADLPTITTVMTLHSSGPSQIFYSKSNTFVVVGLVLCVFLLLLLFCFCFSFSFYFLEYMVTEILGFKSQLSHLIGCCTFLSQEQNFLQILISLTWTSLQLICYLKIVFTEEKIKMRVC